MLGIAMSAIHTGFGPEIIRIEADVAGGFPKFSIVGLPDSSVRESKLRIRSAFKNSSLQFPQGRITVNLTPAHFRKRGSGLDLAIAIAILRASGQLPSDEGQTAFLAELELSGNLAPVEGAIGLSLRLSERGITKLFGSAHQPIPNEFLRLTPFTRVMTLQNVVQAIRYNELPTVPDTTDVPALPNQAYSSANRSIDLIEGRVPEKRLLSIAAAGHHHLLLVGPPGIGKTLLAHSLVELLPDLDEIGALHAFARNELLSSDLAITRRPPLRTPHHSLTVSGMIGGGNPPQPGEVTLAHDGVLLLDELFEFRRATLDALREPLVNQNVHLTRGGRSVVLPANFLFVATANPCLCGQNGYGECRCLESEVRRYWGRCSGPVLDRIEIVQFLNRQSVTKQELTADLNERDSDRLRDAVQSAQQMLKMMKSNPQSAGLHRRMSAPASRVYQLVLERVKPTERTRIRLVSLAQTIAALDSRDILRSEDIEEALSLRRVE